MVTNFALEASVNSNDTVFIKSEDIKVFPCAYRNSSYDFEAKLNTENNLRNLLGKHLNDSYILSWKGDILEVSIKGYYFKISNLTKTYFPLDSAETLTGDWYLKIKLQDISQEGDTDSTTLSPLKEVAAVQTGTSGAEMTASAETIELDQNIEEFSYFTGCVFTQGDTADSSNGEYSLKCFAINGGASNAKTLTIASSSFFPTLKAGNYPNSILGGGEGLTDNNANQAIFGRYNSNTASFSMNILPVSEEDSSVTLSDSLSSDSFIVGGGVKSDSNITRGNSLEVTPSYIHGLKDIYLDNNLYAKGTIYTGSLTTSGQIKTNGHLTVSGESSTLSFDGDSASIIGDATTILGKQIVFLQGGNNGEGNIQLTVRGTTISGDTFFTNKNGTATSLEISDNNIQVLATTQIDGEDIYLTGSGTFTYGETISHPNFTLENGRFSGTIGTISGGEITNTKITGSTSIYLTGNVSSQTTAIYNYQISTPSLVVNNKASISSNGDITASSLTLRNTGNSLTTSGTITAQSFNASSDRRLKENIENYSPAGNILDLPVKSFNFKNSKKKYIGCIAQDLEKICPEIVEENSDGYLSIQENKIVYLLLLEVKKLKSEIEELKKKLN